MPTEDSSVAAIGGLTEAAAQARLKAEGYNELPRPGGRTPFRIIFEVLREPMMALLLGGGVIYLALGDRTEALILLVFATLSVSITVVQETRTEHVLEALRDLTSPRALVIRGWRAQTNRRQGGGSWRFSWCRASARGRSRGDDWRWRSFAGSARGREAALVAKASGLEIALTSSTARVRVTFTSVRCSPGWHAASPCQRQHCSPIARPPTP